MFLRPVDILEYAILSSYYLKTNKVSVSGVTNILL